MRKLIVVSLLLVAGVANASGFPQQEAEARQTHLTTDTGSTHIDGKFCSTLDPREQQPGRNCIPNGGVGGASGK